MLAAAYIPELDILAYLFLLLPLLLLLVWFLAFQSKRYGAMLLWGILLVIFDLLHIAAIYASLRDVGRLKLDIVSVLLILGVVCFLIGIFGIVSGVKGLGSATLNRGEVICSLKHTGPTCMLPDGIAKLHLEERPDGPSASMLSQPGLLRQRAGGTGAHHYP
jgi:hypothetical protein